MTSQKLTPEEALAQKMAIFNEDCDNVCKKIDGQDTFLNKKAKSGKMDGAGIEINKSNNMKIENPYGTPDPDERVATKFDVDVSKDSIDDIKNSRSRDTDMSEEEKFDREIARREAEKSKGDMKDIGDKKVSSDTDMSEEEKFAGEVASRETKKSTTESEAKAGDKGENDNIEELDPDAIEEVKDGPNIEELKNTLDEARRKYAKIHYKSEGAWNKIKNVLGQVNDELDRDVVFMKDSYQKALEDFRNAKLSGLEGMSDDQKRDAMLELREFDLNEKVNLYEDRVTVKAEKYPIIVGKMALGVINKYKKLPMSAKIAFSGALFAGGLLITGGTGAAVLGSMAFAKRALGAGMMGTGVTAGFEARAQHKESKEMKKALDAFKEMDFDKQKTLLSSFDNESFKQLESSFHGKIAGRSRRVLYGIGTTAGMMALGGAGKLFGIGGGTEEVGSSTSGAGTTVTGGGVNEGPGTSFVENQNYAHSAEGESPMQETVQQDVDKIMEEHKQQAMNLPETDRDKMEEHLIKLAQDTANNDGTVNTELLQQEANKAFEQYQFNTDISETQQPDFEHATDAGESPMQETDMEMGVFSGIEIGENGIGTLTVEEGSSIEGTLIKFLEANSEKLTEGGMGWDTDKYKDVHEWAGKRAHGLAQEFAVAHPGVDLDTVQPDTTLELNLSDSADIKMDVDFEGGSRIVPEGVKTEISGEESNVGIEQTGGIAEQISTTKEVLGTFGITEEQFAQISDKPVSQVIDIAAGKSPETLTPLEQTLLDLSKPGSNVDLTGKTVGEVVNNININILTDNNIVQQSANADMFNVEPGEKVAHIESMTLEEKAEKLKHLAEQMGIEDDGKLEAVTQGGVITEINGQEVPEHLLSSDTVVNPFEGMTEEQVRGELYENKNFVNALGLQIQETFGSSTLESIKHIANTELDLFLEGNNTDTEMQSRVNGVITRAKETFGNNVGSPGDDATVQSYFGRIFARAVQEGKVKNVFPSSSFSL